MIDLKNIFDNKQYDSNQEVLVELSKDVYSLKWEQAYWLAKCFEDFKPEGITDNSIIQLFEYAFDNGLDKTIDYEIYIDASEQLARMYIRNKDYDYANNILMELTRILKPVPDWVYINYCISQIKSDNVYRHAMDPGYFFKLLDSISMDSYQTRARIYQMFLNRLYEIKEKEPNKKISITKFEDLKFKYIGHVFDE